MKNKISIITLAVQDLDRAKMFYEQGMGLEPHPESKDEIAFYDMHGTWLSLYPRDRLADDIGITADSTGFSGVTIAHNEPNEEGVRQVIEAARKAGGMIIKEPEKVFWGGYSGYFADPDGNIWEVAYNPFMDLT